MWTASGFGLLLHIITYFISTQRPLMHGVDHFEYITQLYHLVAIVFHYGFKKYFFKEKLNARIIFN